MSKSEFSIEDINDLDINKFHMVYVKYFKILMYYAMQFIDSSDTAKDIVQDLFSIIWERKIQFKSVYSFKRYLYVSVRNASLDYLKHKNIENVFVQDSLQENQIRNDSVEDVFCKEEIYRKLFEAIDQLPPRCKEVFILSMEGKKSKEIASILKVSFETVKTHKKLAFRNIRHAFRNEDELLFLIILAYLARL